MADANKVTPQPAPVTVDTGFAELADGSKAVVLTIHSVNGSGVYFMPPDFADKIADWLVSAAQQARTGLVVPGVVQLPLNRNNGHGG